jgi:cellulose synthase/poly-beta-1,6-N-acetylglucosamine synthase-like glycosyltransferase
MDLHAPFEGLPLPWVVLDTICLVVVVGIFFWIMLLFVRGHATIMRPPAPPAEGAEGFTWVFLVPAMNEEVVIADSVRRLVEVPVARKRIVVIDDASDDGTPEILAGIEHPDLFILRRDRPDAQKGKAAGLNYAYRALREYDDREHTIVAIVDADGRLDPDAPLYASSHFVEPKVGGVQALVRMYNRGNLLTWMQDVEFAVYGHLFQAGRNDWGTAGMGGNGQFNRLSALDAIADEEGPWRDKLTEDQDLGLRLIAQGWEGRQDLRAYVSQQGLSKVLPLIRQRTRWSQGNLQAIALWPQVLGAPFGWGARLEQMAFIFLPFWQGIMFCGMVSAVLLAVLGVASFWGGGPTWELVFFYLMAFGGTSMGCVAAKSGQGPAGWAKGFLTGQVYTFYTWLLWPVLLRSTARQLARRDSWAKTARESLDAEPAQSPVATQTQSIANG